MNKEKFIERFKAAIKLESNRPRRWLSVQTQYNRNVWRLIDDIGKIQIDFNKKSPLITCYDIKSGFGILSVKISIEEYNELKKLYFGHFEPDVEYLKDLGVSEEQIEKPTITKKKSFWSWW